MNAARRRSDGPADEGISEGASAWPPIEDHAALDGAGLDDPASPDREAGALESAPGLCGVFAEQQLGPWLASIVERDERALAALYDATFSRVFGLVQRIVRNRATAEEVVEEVYFQVWRQAVRFDPSRGKALAWILSMARSRAIDALRREARCSAEGADADAQPGAVSDEPAADELLELARRQADLAQALMLLGAQPRQLVSLAFFRGMSHEEIAQHMRLPLGTVKSQIRRALLTLRGALGERGSPAVASSAS
ncbi:MAG: sigma-70 family RNA polymerase sigma factor [Rubrivivax sp.]